MMQTETTSIFTLANSLATEVFINAVGLPGEPAAAQIRRVYAESADVLRQADARIVQERLFVPADAAGGVAQVRGAALGSLADAVAPALLRSAGPAEWANVGLQIHAVRTDQPIRLVERGGVAVGRTLDLAGVRHVFLSGLSAAEAGSPGQQAGSMFEQTEQLFNQAGGNMHSVVRTWLWLGEILSWYDELNDVRRKFFRRCGLIAGEGQEPKLPASTGIGVRPTGSAMCAMDARGVVPIGGGRPSQSTPGNGELIAYFNAAGRQDSPFRYGSAFARAATAVSPAGKTLFISGSAAIDPAGASCHLGDARAQIEMTLRHIRAILAEHGCGDGDVVQAMAYCKTPAVAAAWRAGWPDFEWPAVTLIADVCRDELLFEAELMACPGVKSGLR